MISASSSRTVRLYLPSSPLACGVWHIDDLCCPDGIFRFVAAMTAAAGSFELTLPVARSCGSRCRRPSAIPGVAVGVRGAYHLFRPQGSVSAVFFVFAGLPESPVLLWWGISAAGQFSSSRRARRHGFDNARTGGVLMLICYVACATDQPIASRLNVRATLPPR